MSVTTPWYHSVQNPNTEQDDFHLGVMVAFVQVLNLTDQELGATVVGQADIQAIANALSAFLQAAAERGDIHLPPGLDLKPSDLQLTPERRNIWWSQDECAVFRSRLRGGPSMLFHVRLRLPAAFQHVEPPGSTPPAWKYDLLREYIQEFYKGALPLKVPVAEREAQVSWVIPDFLAPTMNGGSGAGGGPGSMPRPISTPELNTIAAHLGQPVDQCIPHVRFSPTPSGDPNIEALLEDSPHGENVLVLVLDTAPTLARILNPAVNDQVDNNPLLMSLRSRLTEVRSFDPIIHLPAKPTEADPKLNSDAGEPYTMTDHGLFIAGLIHDIAPKAEIRLWRVLNDQGLSEVSTVVEGLAAALAVAQIEGRPVVVNLSLVINAPVEDWRPNWGNLVGNAFRDVLGQIIEQHLGTQCALVAAAGNGSDGPAPRREPRYPARFDSLISVAATTCARFTDVYGDGGHPTDYADCGDEPGTPANGVATFGGEADWSPPIAAWPRRLIKMALLDTGPAGPIVDMPDAPIGIFIGKDVPEADPGRPLEPNDTGWAAWAGSSFATPIISGLVAALWLPGDSSEVAIVRVRNLATDPTPGLTLRVQGIRAYQLRTRP